jgi:putative tryptophan/tyrosine transport system substrate-binding protein
MKTWFPAFLVALVLVLAEGFAEAEQRTKVPRVGYLGWTSPRLFEAFQQGLRELDYVEGQNIIVERETTQEDAWALHSRAAQLVRLKPEVIVAASASAGDTALNATQTIPIVLTDPGVDPVATGLVASLERPGGNVTGVGGMAIQLGGKWLELLKEAVPGVRRVAVFWHQDDKRGIPLWKEVEIAARSLRVELLPIHVWYTRSRSGSRSDHLGIAFRNATRRGAEALIVLAGGYDLTRAAQLALQHRLPAIYWRAGFTEAGGLMAYGPKLQEQHRRAASFVDKILKGAKPSDLPVERPTQFELVINLKTAKEIGVTIHPEVLMFADRVIK